RRQPKKALAYDRQAVALFERLAEDFPGVPDYRHQLARAQAQLGGLLFEAGQPEPAEKAWRTAEALWAKLAADVPAFTDYQVELARSRRELGIVLAVRGQRVAA